MVVVLMGVNLILATWLYFQFDTSFVRADGNDGYQFIEHAVWIRSLNVEYFVGIDGISISMIFLTDAHLVRRGARELQRQGAAQGLLRDVLPARDGDDGRVRLARLLPLLRVLGGHAPADVLPHRHLGRPAPEYAAIKFFLYTLAGSRLHAARLHLRSTTTATRRYLVDGQAVHAHLLDARAHARRLDAARASTILGFMAS